MWLIGIFIGTGKTHLLIGLRTAAAQDGFRVRYTLATKLVNELVEAADERQLAKTIARSFDVRREHH
jgi:DNA replication protein DnaC